MKNSISTTVLALATTLLLTVTSSFGQSATELMAKGDVFDASFRPADALLSYLPAENEAVRSGIPWRRSI